MIEWLKGETPEEYLERARVKRHPKFSEKLIKAEKNLEKRLEEERLETIRLAEDFYYENKTYDYFDWYVGEIGDESITKEFIDKNPLIMVKNLLYNMALKKIDITTEEAINKVNEAIKNNSISLNMVYRFKRYELELHQYD